MPAPIDGNGESCGHVGQTDNNDIEDHENASATNGHFKCSMEVLNRIRPRRGLRLLVVVQFQASEREK